MSDAGDQLDLSKIVLKVSADGRPYELRMGDFSALDEFDYEQATGHDLITPFTTGRINSIMVAGLVWLHRRRYEKALQFPTVAKKFTWADLSTVVIKNENEDDPEPEPALPRQVEITDPES